jgi:hypothetical protein
MGIFSPSLRLRRRDPGQLLLKWRRRYLRQSTEGLIELQNQEEVQRNHQREGYGHQALGTNASDTEKIGEAQDDSAFAETVGLRHNRRIAGDHQ